MSTLRHLCYETGGNFGSFTILFRSGKATFIDMGGNQEVFEGLIGVIKSSCTRQAILDMPIDIDNGGTLQTPWACERNGWYADHDSGAD